MSKKTYKQAALTGMRETVYIIFKHGQSSKSSIKSSSQSNMSNLAKWSINTI